MNHRANTGPAADPRLDAVRGTQKAVRLNARRVAGIADNPGCRLRTVADLARISLEKTSESAGVPAPYGQSPFAITRGNAFERRLKRDTNYDMLFAALTQAIGLPPERYSVEDLGEDGPIGLAAVQRRAYTTVQKLRWILSGDPDAPALLDHPVLTLVVAGETVYVEPDALALVAVDRKFVLVEIKSFPSVDQVIDKAKAAAAARQVAVYVHALRQVVADLGHDPNVISTDAVLITPENTTTSKAVGSRLPTADRLIHLQRQLRRITSISNILDELPPGFTLDPQAADLVGLDDGARQDALADKLRQVPSNYVPGCRSACGLGEFCHREAVTAGNPVLIGPSVRDDLAGIRDLRQATRIAAGQPLPADTDAPADTSLALRRARRIEDAARARVAARQAGGVA
ncbi:hypothetical protein ABZ235_39160 [Streptomyces canus]|uniref:hypothetical protein n=1 Tax=Streptomyces canus TaxID=58343 RepID=UPI0033AFD3B6